MTPADKLDSNSENKLDVVTRIKYLIKRLLIRLNTTYTAGSCKRYSCGIADGSFQLYGR